MKTSLHRRLILTGLAATAAFTSPLLAQFFTDPNATGAWNTARWNNGADGPTYTANYSQGFPVQFTTGNNYSFAGMGAGLSVGNVTVAPGVTVNFASTGGTYGTGGNIRTIDIGAGALFDLSANNVSTAAGTGFIKTGAGTWALAGAAYTGGFTLNAGTVIARGINYGRGGRTQHQWRRHRGKRRPQLRRQIFDHQRRR